MGAGIAQLAAAAGHPVLLYDAWDGAAEKGRARIAKGLEGLVKRGRMTEAESAAIMARIAVVTNPEAFAGAALAIEAVVEDLEVKRKLFAQLEAVMGDDAILATNTSYLDPNAIAEGNPAQVVGYTTALPRDVPVVAGGGPEADSNRTRVEIVPLEVGKAAIYRMPQVLEASRGNLTVGEIERDLPFLPKRYFAIYDVPSAKLRGEHAHRACHQFLICLKGACRALLDDGENRQEVLLSRPDVGLYLPPMIWGTQYDYTRDAVLLVFASHSYDNADYIRDYETFRAALDAAR